MSISESLMYPAMHKFYNALSSLEKFEKGNNFFDNISHLDNFFSEYRNITFVMQKSLAHSGYKPHYDELRPKYLNGELSKWFNDKRNEVLKERPFELEKVIQIRIFSAKSTIALPQLNFTVENDIELSTVIGSLRETFSKLNSVEVFFSAEFFFYERGKSVELYPNLIDGIDRMKKFIGAMKERIDQVCEVCDQLEKRIDSMTFYSVPKNMLFVDDYVYDCRKDQFEKAQRVEMGVHPPAEKVPLARLVEKLPIQNDNEDLFKQFVIWHLSIFSMQQTLMPTCMIVYDDGTFNLNSFDSSIKTTTYRKFNEIADRIEIDGIVEVLFVSEMLTFDRNEEILRMTSKDRVSHKKSELLAFFVVRKNLSFDSRFFESEKIGSLEDSKSPFDAANPYIGPTLANYMNPILANFRQLKDDK